MDSVYMDYNATTPLAPEVMECMREALQYSWANPSSQYQQGKEAREEIEKARASVAALIGTVNPEDILFTSGGTEANNMVIFGIIKYFKEAKAKQKSATAGLPHIVTTNVEHDAVILPIKHLEEEELIECTVVPVNKKGVIDVDEILAAIRPNTVLLTVMMANNETGVIMPISEIGQKLQRINRQRISEGLVKILYHTDAAQAVGKILVDVEDLLVDYLTIVGHKFYGPRGGCLYVRGPQTATPVYPMFFGGGQERGIRPGTENTLICIGLGKAAFLARQYFNQNQSLFICFREYLETKLKDTFGESAVIHFRNPDVPFLPNTCSVALLTTEKISAAHILKASQLEASVGAACHSQDNPSSILTSSGLSHGLARATIRLSIGMLTSKIDIDEAVQSLAKAIQTLSRAEGLKRQQLL